MIISDIRSISLVVAASLLILASVPGRAATFVVNALQDSVDVSPGDGICNDDSGRCTLRAAVMETNALPGPDGIWLSIAGVYALTIPGAGENGSATGDLDIRDDLQIIGRTRGIFVDGRQIDRVFHVLPNDLGQGPSVSIEAVTIRNGNADVNGADDSGGGIEVGDPLVAGNATLTMRDVVVRDNRATFGGGVFNGFGGSVAIIASTIGPSNVATFGGGLYARDDKRVILTNSTVSANVADSGGGGIDVFFNATVLLNGVTVAGNTALLGVGAGILRESNAGPVVLRNSIVGENVMGGNCGGVMISLGNNLAADMSCNLRQASDLPNADPQLVQLADNGGLTLTYELAPGSPAASHIPLTSCLAVDQRHIARPQPLNNSACDIGALESDQ